MQYTYQMCADRIVDEAGTEYSVYGIRAVDADGTVLAAYPDVYFEPTKAERLVETCNRLELELVHLPEVVEDAIQQEYMV